jgi:archaeosine-15-forming tRNA-guanine transglycosylase
MESETATVSGKRPAEEARVIRWRAEELVRAGYSAFAADVISVHTEIDLHRATELPRNGCPHDLALRILL